MAKFLQPLIPLPVVDELTGWRMIRALYVANIQGLRQRPRHLVNNLLSHPVLYATPVPGTLIVQYCGSKHLLTPDLTARFQITAIFTREQFGPSKLHVKLIRSNLPELRVELDLRNLVRGRNLRQIATYLGSLRALNMPTFTLAEIQDLVTVSSLYIRSEYGNPLNHMSIIEALKPNAGKIDIDENYDPRVFGGFVGKGFPELCSPIQEDYYKTFPQGTTTQDHDLISFSNV